MFIELIATFAAGIGVAGCVLLLNRISGGRLPKWAMPVCAGFAMIGYTIWSEYTWFERTKNNLPEGLVVAQAVESKALYRPWTYVLPFVNRFTAVDKLSVRQNPAAPGQRVVNIVVMGRWAPVSQVPILLDCPEKKIAEISEATVFGDDGQVQNPDWRGLTDDDALFVEGCAGSSGDG